MVISDMLCILQYFNLNFMSFLLLILYYSITIDQHLRLDYCENFKLAGKETIDKLKWNIILFSKILSIF